MVDRIPHDRFEIDPFDVPNSVEAVGAARGDPVVAVGDQERGVSGVAEHGYGPDGLAPVDGTPVDLDDPSRAALRRFRIDAPCRCRTLRGVDDDVLVRETELGG